MSTRWIATMIVVGAAPAAGCGGSGTAGRGPAAPEAGPGPVVVGAPAPRPVPAAPAPGGAAQAVARSTTRWLYARLRARVRVAPASRGYRAALRGIAVPAGLRGARVAVQDVRAVVQTPGTAIASWTVVDGRSRYPLVVGLALRGGRWRAEELQGD